MTLSVEYERVTLGFMPSASQEEVERRMSYAYFRTAGCDIAVCVHDKWNRTTEWIGLTGTPIEIAQYLDTLKQEKINETGGWQTQAISIECILDVKSTFQKNIIRPEINEAIAKGPTGCIQISPAGPLARMTTFSEAFKIWQSEGAPNPRKLGMI